MPPSVLGYQRISALMIDVLGGREGESVALVSPSQLQVSTVDACVAMRMCSLITQVNCLVICVCLPSWLMA